MFLTFITMLIPKYITTIQCLALLLFLSAGGKSSLFVEGIAFDCKLMNIRHELFCCKCDDSDSPLKWIDQVCYPYGKATTTTINNLTCPYNFDNTPFSSLAGCNQNADFFDNDEFSASIKKTALNDRFRTNTMWRRSKGKWIKCCCSTYFCKFQHIKTSSDKNLLLDTHFPKFCNSMQKSSYRFIEKGIIAMIDVMLKCILSLGEALFILEVLYVLALDTTTFWNEIIRPIYPAELLAELMLNLIKWCKVFVSAA